MLGHGIGGIALTGGCVLCRAVVDTSDLAHLHFRLCEGMMYIVCMHGQNING